jgi:hypothetical protein
MAPIDGLFARMKGVSTLLGIVSLVFSVACSGSSGTSGTDGGTEAATKKDSGGKTDAGTDSAGPFSVCGHPGDKGNSKGVGQYCTTSTECPATAPICSNLENSMMPKDKQTFFCVLPGCNACSPPGFCGDNATCACEALGCGCTPNTCSAVIPDGGAGVCMDAAGGG